MENYNYNYKLQCFSSGADTEPNAEFITHSVINDPIYQHSSALNMSSLPLQNQDFPAGLFIHHNYNSNHHHHHHHIITDHAQTKRKLAMEISSSSPSPTSTPQSSDHDQTRTKNMSSVGRGKQARRDEIKEGKLEAEVVHVRAKRGQATDSHSLAERVRREKINERLRCLQDIVPGCYKTMGMAVMLDEIINYVQSLQNQVEFLSMKLTAASSFHDFSSEADDDALETMQRAKTFEASKIHNGTPAAQFPPFGFNFEYCPDQFPHNKS